MSKIFQKCIFSRINGSRSGLIRSQLHVLQGISCCQDVKQCIRTYYFHLLVLGPKSEKLGQNRSPTCHDGMFFHSFFEIWYFKKWVKKLLCKIDLKIGLACSSYNPHQMSKINICSKIHIWWSKPIICTKICKKRQFWPKISESPY